MTILVTESDQNCQLGMCAGRARVVNRRSWIMDLNGTSGAISPGMKTPAELAAMSRPTRRAKVHETVTYVIAVGALFVGRNGLRGLEHATHFHSADNARSLAALLRLKGFEIMARGRESLRAVA